MLQYAHWFKRGQVIQLSPVHWVKWKEDCA
nr:MAG TPA: hypothetical protein [Caudoviricetes sp.]